MSFFPVFPFLVKMVYVRHTHSFLSRVSPPPPSSSSRARARKKEESDHKLCCCCCCCRRQRRNVRKGGWYIIFSFPLFFFFFFGPKCPKTPSCLLVAGEKKGQGSKIIRFVGTIENHTLLKKRMILEPFCYFRLYRREETSTSRARHRHSPAVIIEHDLRMHRTNLPR